MRVPCSVIRFAACVLTLTSLIAPASAGDMLARSEQAYTRHRAATQVLREISLQNGNTLHGSVVDDAGMPQANYEVWIAPDDGPAVKTRTDTSGRFTVPGVLPGIYNIDTPCGGGRFRLWEAKDAPREAQTNVLLIVCTKQNG